MSTNSRPFQVAGLGCLMRFQKGLWPFGNKLSFLNKELISCLGGDWRHPVFAFRLGGLDAKRFVSVSS
jgi:hypothetical protein